jgi:dihydroorotate dehydrogenase (NAD+) catalytic subunit
MVYECAELVKIPVIGIGGITCARDVVEFLIAGATAVQVGTANFVDPFIWPKLLAGLREYLQRHQMTRVTELTGSLITGQA